MATERYYGVSSGDGNNGVSQMYPRYIVKTSDPWRLAKLAAISDFKEGEGQKWAKEEMQVDGEADYTISATFLEGPDGETAYGAAWLIYEVFPVEQDEVESWRSDPYKIIYESLEDCFGAEFVAANPAQA